MGKKVSKVIQFIGDTNEGTDAQLLKDNTLKRIINMEVRTDGQIDRRKELQQYDSGLDSLLDSLYTTVTQLFYWDTEKTINGMDSNSPILISYGNYPLGKLYILYKRGGSWTSEQLTDDNISFTNVSSIRITATNERVLFADGINRLYTLSLDKAGNVLFYVAGIPAPTDKIIITDYEHTSIESDGSTDNYIDAGIEKERGTILFYYYTLKTENGDESNPSPLTEFIFDRLLDKTDDTVLGYGSFLSSVTLSNIKLPYDIDEDVKALIKYICIYRTSATYSNGIVETMETAKKIAQITISDKDGETVYEDKNIDGSVSISTENDMPPISDDVVAVGRKIVVSGLTDSTRFLWGFENAREIKFENNSGREFIDFILLINLTETDIDSSFDWDDYFNSNENYKKRLRFFYNDKRTPLMCMTAFNTTQTGTTRKFAIKIPLVTRGTNTIYIAWSDTDIVPTDYISTDKLGIDLNNEYDGEDITIATYYGMPEDYNSLIYISAGMYHYPYANKINFVDNLLRPSSEGILAHILPFITNNPVLVDKDDSQNLALSNYYYLNLPTFIPLIDNKTELDGHTTYNMEKKYLTLRACYSNSDTVISAGVTKTIDKAYKRTIYNKGFILAIFTPQVSSYANTVAQTNFIQFEDESSNTFSIGVERENEYLYNVALSDGTTETKIAKVKIPSGKAGVKRNIAVLFSWKKEDWAYIYISNPTESNYVYQEAVSYSNTIADLVGNSLKAINLNSTTVARAVNEIIMGSTYIGSVDRARELIAHLRISNKTVGGEIDVTYNSATIQIPSTKQIYGDATAEQSGTTVTIKYTNEVLKGIATGDYLIIQNHLSLNGTYKVDSNDASTGTITCTASSSSTVTASACFVSKLLEDDDFSSDETWAGVSIVSDDDNYYLYVKRVGSSSPYTYYVYAHNSSTNQAKLSFTSSKPSGIITLKIADIPTTETTNGNYWVSYAYYPDIATMRTALYDSDEQKIIYREVTDIDNYVWNDAVTIYNDGGAGDGVIIKVDDVLLYGYAQESITNGNITIGDKVQYDKHNNMIQYNEGEYLEFPDLNYKINNEPIKRILLAPRYLPFANENAHLIIVFSLNAVNVLSLDDDNKPVNITMQKYGYGLKASNSLISTPYGVFWLSEEGIMRWDNQGMQPIDHVNGMKILNGKYDESLKALYVPQRKQVWFYYESNKNTVTKTVSFTGNYFNDDSIDVEENDYIEITGFNLKNTGIYKVVKQEGGNTYIDGWFETDESVSAIFTVKDVIYVYDIPREQWYIFIGISLDDWTLINISGYIYNLILNSNAVYKYPTDTDTAEETQAIKEIREYYSGANKILTDFEGTAKLDLMITNNRLTYGGKAKNDITLKQVDYKLLPDGYFGYVLGYKIKDADTLKYAELIIVQRGGLDEKV